MRVALVDPSLFTLPYDTALASGLADEGHEVVLHGCPLPDGEAAPPMLARSFYRVAERKAVRALPGPARLAVKGVDHALSMAALARRLRRAPPDVIHFQWLALPAIDRALLAGLRRAAPLVLTVHDSDPFNGNPASLIQRLGARAALRGFDRLIVHTAQGRARLLADGADPARLETLPHGLLAAPPAALPGDPMQGTLTLLLFGKIKPYKGADVLIEAFARLPPALREQARLRIVGKPYMDLAPLRARAGALGVEVALDPGFVADDAIPALLGPGTVAVFPYREIEASGVLSLAIAHGRPIVASRIGGFAETLADGTHGLLVPPGDPAALAAALGRMLADRAFAAGCARAVADLARATPDWRAIARRTVAVYDAARAGRAQAARSPWRSAAAA